MCGVHVEQVRRRGVQAEGKVREQLGSSSTFHCGLAPAMTLSLRVCVQKCVRQLFDILSSYLTHCLPARPTTHSQTHTYSPVST